jgi:trigger factor
MRFCHRILSVVLLAATSHAFVPHKTSRTPAFVGSTASPWSSMALQASTLERLPDSAVRVKLEIPGSATKAAYEKVCNEVSKTITIPGFRKGSRIPAQVLEQAMAAKIGRNAMRVQAINELLAELIEPALKEEHGLEPIGQPKLETPAEDIATDFEPGKDFQLSVHCDVWPDIEWKTIEGKEKPYLGLKASYTRKPFNQSKFDKALNDLKERYATLETIEDKNHGLQMGDACVVNMEGYMATESGEKGDKLPDAASGDRVEVILGEGRYMTGLVEGLIGAKIGDIRTVSVTFPTVSAFLNESVLVSSPLTHNSTTSNIAGPSRQNPGRKEGVI